MVDASEGLAAQDTHIAGIIQEQHKGVIIVVNKWDLAQQQRRDEREGVFAKPDDEIESAEGYREIIDEGLKFLPYAPTIFASAKTGYHVKTILDTALQIADTRYMRVPTARLNEVLREAVRRHDPSLIRSRPLKLYYGTQTHVNPPTFVFFINDTESMHFSYERYLENRLREAFGFKGTAIRLFFRPRNRDREER
jgi:GTP-binding protein